MATVQQVREQFKRNGITVAEWARENHFPAQLVREVLLGRAKGNWGLSHDIAVKLGLKDGPLGDERRISAPATR